MTGVEICGQTCAGCAQPLGAAERGEQTTAPTLAAGSTLDTGGRRAPRLPGAGETLEGRGVRSTGAQSCGLSPREEPRKSSQERCHLNQDLKSKFTKWKRWRGMTLRQRECTS